MMYCKCDGCGNEAEAVYTGREWIVPSGWATRVVPQDWSGDPRVLLICCLGCAEAAEHNRFLIREKNREERRLKVLIADLTPAKGWKDHLK